MGTLNRCVSIYLLYYYVNRKKSYFFPEPNNTYAKKDSMIEL